MKTEDFANALTDGKRLGSNGLGDLAGWTLGGKKTNPAYEVAVRALAAAAPCSVNKGKQIARDAQGIKRMSTKRWEDIIALGAEHGVLSVVDGKITSREVAAPAPSSSKPKPKAVPKRGKAKKAPSSMKGSGPRKEPCGHTQWNTASPKEQKAARKAGHCCVEAQNAASTGKHLSPPDWQVRGLTFAVPANLRRTLEKSGGPGWPGYCCHPKTGLYIGGIGNDCRRTKTKVRCVAHAKVSEKHK